MRLYIRYWLRYKGESGGQSAVFFVVTTPSGIQKVRGDLQSLLTSQSGPQFVLVPARGDGKRSPSFHGTVVSQLSSPRPEVLVTESRLHQSPESLSVERVYSLCLGTQTILLTVTAINLYTLGKSDGCGFACVYYRVVPII